MRIVSMAPPTPGRASEVARFDLQLNPHVKLNHLMLRRNRRGEFRVYAPNVRCINVANFAPALADDICRLAVDYYNTWRAEARDHTDVAA